MLHWNPSPLTAAACFCCHRLLQKSGGFSWWSFSQFLCIPRHRLASAPPLLLNLPNQWRLLLFESFTENVLLASQVLKTLFSSWLLWQLATLFFLRPLCSHHGILGGSFSLECQGPLFFVLLQASPSHCHLFSVLQLAPRQWSTDLLAGLLQALHQQFSTWDSVQHVWRHLFC